MVPWCNDNGVNGPVERWEATAGPFDKSIYKVDKSMPDQYRVSENIIMMEYCDFMCFIRMCSLFL